MNEHLLKRFDERLDKLIGRLEKMGGIAHEQVADALRSLAEADAELARCVIDRDTKLDKLDIKVDRLGMAIVAAHQPVAMDLRLIMAGLSINRMIERIGDCAVAIAEQVLALEQRCVLVHRTMLLETGASATRMVESAMRAFLDMDPARAREVVIAGTTLAEIEKHNFSQVIGLMAQDPSLVEPCSQLLLVSRNSKRIADEAAGIAEEVIFIVEAVIVRHKRLTDITPRAASAQADDSSGNEASLPSA
jgi:phosphate transport system protein